MTEASRITRPTTRFTLLLPLLLLAVWGLGTPAQWAPACDGQIPHGALSVGKAVDGAPLYLARADYMGSRQPGKVRRGVPAAHFSYAGKTVEARCYEVYTGQGAWPCAMVSTQEDRASI